MKTFSMIVAAASALSFFPITAAQGGNAGFVYVAAKGKPIAIVDLRAQTGRVRSLVELDNDVIRTKGPGLPLVFETRPDDLSVSGYSIGLAVRKEKDASVAIVLRNAADREPGFAVYPEERVAVINADTYENKDIRLVKEIWRSIGYVSGAGFSKYAPDPMKPVWNLADLDNVQGTRLVAATILNLDPFLNSFGIKCAANVSYSLACSLGIAPKPTNDVQKAIWEENYAPPQKPIKITYDKDKQKPVVK